MTGLNEIKSKCGTRVVGMSITKGITVILFLFALGGAMIKHEDRYAKADEIEAIKQEIKEMKHVQSQMQMDLMVIKSTQNKIQLSIIDNQKEILKRFNEISKQ